MNFREKVFYETKELNIGDHWRFQHYSKTMTLLELDYKTFTKEMDVLCNEGWFSAIQDDLVTHYQVTKK